MNDELLIERGAVLRLTINRPRRRNALTSELLVRLTEAVESVAVDPNVRVITLRGAGGAFSAGADLDAVGGLDAAAADAVMDSANRLVRAIIRAPQIVVSLVQGPAVAFGAALAFAADLVVADDRASFLVPFTKIGLMPDGGATAFIAGAAGRGTAARMALLGDALTAQQAAEQGLVARVFPHADFETAAAALIGALAAGPRTAQAQTKKAIRLATLTALDPVLDLEAVEQARLLLGPDFTEGAAAFAAGRPPRFAGVPSPEAAATEGAL